MQPDRHYPIALSISYSAATHSGPQLELDVRPARLPFIYQPQDGTGQGGSLDVCLVGSCARRDHSPIWGHGPRLNIFCAAPAGLGPRFADECESLTRVVPLTREGAGAGNILDRFETPTQVHEL